jgi:quinoprotein glucose dehydrogenase
MINHNFTSIIVLFGFLLLLNSCTTHSEKPSKLDYTKWEEYLGGPDRNQYSTLSQITLATRIACAENI